MATSFLKLYGGKSLSFNYLDNPTVECLYETVEETTAIPAADFYFICSGRTVTNSESVKPGATYHVVPRLIGGKGGFGSMLRAIGAQIEKTTSREACRDLSGRRMRDVNNEKKLREWVAKKAEREREKEERRQQRLERRRAEPKHKFDDPDYEDQKRTVIENLDDALEEGLKNAGLAAAKKRKGDGAEGCSAKKACEWPGEDSDGLSDLDSLSDSEDPVSPRPYTSESSGQGPSRSTSSSPQLDPGHTDQSVCNIHNDSSEKSPSITEPLSNQAEASTSKPTSESSMTQTQITSSGPEVLSTEATQDSIKSDTRDSNSAIQPTENKESSKETSSEIKPTEDEQTSEESQKGPVEIDLSLYNGAEELEALGLEALKAALTARGLKCGGSLTERAARLFSVKGLTRDEIKPALFAKGGKVKGKK